MHWNLFRNTESCTAYYEPLSPSRYFDPTNRVERVCPTHRGVKDYWSEYQGLDELSQLYRAEWHYKNLLMGPDFWDSDMKRFFEVMIEKAEGRPVLQFNPIDFRLPWVRRNFANARLIHLYRHPRDQWCSTVQHNQRRRMAEKDGQIPLHGVFDVGKDASWEEFAKHDYLYLTVCGNDLRHHFPFLEQRRLRHPCQFFYFIWKLSYVFGRRYADYSVAYEAILANREAQLQRLMSAAGVVHYDELGLRLLIAAPAPETRKNYANDAWFREHEEYCETVLNDFLGDPASGTEDGSQTSLVAQGYVE
jgi:hypothetical protein